VCVCVCVSLSSQNRTAEMVVRCQIMAEIFAFHDCRAIIIAASQFYKQPLHAAGDRST